MFAPRKILVPTDFSERSDTALKRALDIAYQYKSTIHLLHVIDNNIYRWAFGGIGSRTLIRLQEEDHLAEAERRIRIQMGLFPLARKVEIVPDIRIGVMPEIIVEKQMEEGIDLMVVGARERRKGVVSRFLIRAEKKAIRSVQFPALVVS